MSRLLVAVKSCLRDKDAGLHDAIRSTWGRDFGTKALVRFFMGINQADIRTSRVLKSDEIVMDVKDDYLSLPHKTRAVCKYAVGKGLDHIFLCDNDTFINPKNLLAEPFEILDYGGQFEQGPNEIHTRFDYEDHMGRHPDTYPWAAGGTGYFLSSKAAMEVADNYPLVWAEDMYVGQVLGPLIASGNMLAEHLELVNNGATAHYRKSEMFPDYTPELAYRAYKDGGFHEIYNEAGVK